MIQNNACKVCTFYLYNARKEHDLGGQKSRLSAARSRVCDLVMVCGPIMDIASGSQRVSIKTS
jgi:hypothetical protein